MRHFPATPIEMISTLWRHRVLIFISTKREVLGRYRGSFLGLLWSFFNPIFMLSVYTFVFSEVFKAHWGNNTGSRTEFALVLFAGLIVFNIFAECVNKSPGLIIANPNYVKKIVFPLEILPFVVLLSSLFHASISLAVWMVAYTIFFGPPHLTVLYLPIIILPFLFFVMGVCWIFSSLGVYLRDVTQFVGVITTVLMFLSPIFYPVTALPIAYRHFIYFNPLTAVVEQTRNVLYFGRSPNLPDLCIYWTLTLTLAWLGFFCFQKTRKGFSDVL